jgi:signal transduction histidine kinase
MQDVAEKTYLSAAASATPRFMDCSLSDPLSDSPSDPLSDPSALAHFCQLQVEQIAAQPAIVWAQIVYYDPVLKTQQAAVSREGLDRHTRDELKLKINLAGFPPVLTLTVLPLASLDRKGYLCPIGYKDHQLQYILIIANKPLASSACDYLISCAKLVSKHFELHSSLCHQETENQLLEQIVHRVGHQLRNPLSLISLYAENLRLELAASHTQTQAVVIRDTVQDLLSDLNDLIYCGKSSQLRIALHDIHVLMAETIQDLQPWIVEKQLNMIYSPVPVTLRVDRVQIKQVFTNLLSNAIHFSPKSGTIHLNWQVFQGEVLIQVTDQGQGLSDSDLKKIFTPFYSQRPGGTGLGLTIAKKIILDHQGSLWAQNSPEGGAQFSFTLPRQ